MRAASTPSMLGGSAAPSPSARTASELLEEERVALGGGHDRARPRGASPSAIAATSARAPVAVERLELQQRAVGLRRRPAGPRLEQLGPGEAEQQDRPAAENASV